MYTPEALVSFAEISNSVKFVCNLCNFDESKIKVEHLKYVKILATRTRNGARKLDMPNSI